MKLSNDYDALVIASSLSELEVERAKKEAQIESEAT